MIKDELIENSVSNKWYSIYGEKGKGKIILKLFDDGYKIIITPLTEDDLSLKDLVPFERKYKQKQSKR